MESYGTSATHDRQGMGTEMIGYWLHENMPEDKRLRDAIQLLDRQGVQQRGRSLIIPTARRLIGDVYGMRVYTGPVASPVIEVLKDPEVLTRLTV